MLTLTPKQENFCLSYLETGNATEAYRRSYDAEKMLPATINRSAKALMDHDKITARINFLREPAIIKARCTFEEHLDRLEDLSRKEESEGNYASDITAEISRGKAAGHYTEKMHLKHEGTVDLKYLTIEQLHRIAGGMDEEN